METYEKLLEKTREYLQFQMGLNIIRWDLQTKMPPRGMPQRSQELAVMSKIAHRMATDKKVERLVSKLEENSEDLDYTQRREVELVRRRLDRTSMIPDSLVAQESAQVAITTAVWKKGKDTNNWKLFESELVTLVDISKNIATIMMEGIEAKCLLDAQIDQWEPRMTADTIARVFQRLRKKLIPLVNKYSEASTDIQTDFLKREVPVAIQRNVVTDLASLIGYDTTSENAGGRIDEAEHPFTTGYYDDVRFTIRYTPEDLFSAIFGGLHETGHAIHKQNQNPEWKWMNLGKSCSSGFSESQSRFIENMIGRSPEFWKFYYSRFLKLTNGLFNDISNELIFQAINVVQPSTIRVTADEMTYALHIIIRFEIEQALFESKIEVADIRDLWNEKYEHYLGVEVATDSEGALQDIHWAWAYWGYFPTYQLGNLYAAMMLEKLTRDIPEWMTHVADGNVSTPIQWLIENVQCKSNLYDPAEMIKRITGKKLTPEPFLDYLDGKYSVIFG